MPIKFRVDNPLQRDISKSKIYCFRCSSTTQTEGDGELTETNSTQTDELSFLGSGSVYLSDYHYCFFRRYMRKEMDHFARYVKYLRGFKF